MYFHMRLTTPLTRALTLPSPRGGEGPGARFASSIYSVSQTVSSWLFR